MRKILFEKTDERQVSILRQMSGEQRVRLGAELYEMARRLVADGIRDRSPELTEERIAEKVKEIMAPWSKKKL